MNYLAITVHIFPNRYHILSIITIIRIIPCVQEVVTPILYNELLYKLDQPLTGHTVPHTSMGETHHMIHLFIIISSFLSVHKIWILLSSVSRGLLQVRDKVAFRKWIYWEKKKISWIKRNFFFNFKKRKNESVVLFPPASLCSRGLWLWKI